jgi:hypothetical protein
MAEFIITNVKEDKKYKGAYAKIFSILDKDSIFTNRHETENSIGFKDGKYFLTIDGNLTPKEYDLIKQITNVKIVY